VGNFRHSAFVACSVGESGEHLAHRFPLGTVCVLATGGVGVIIDEHFRVFPSFGGGRVL